MKMRNIGNKAKTLKLLKDNNFNVPQFYALENSDCQKIYKYIENEAALNAYLDSINFKSNVDKLRKPLIVRSSSVNEDGDGQSNAGKYLSIYNINDEIELLESIIKCWCSKDNENDMGVIIQEQIQPYFSGVSFISNNNGELQLIIEVAIGLGELLVSGFISPIRYIYNFKEDKFEIHQDFTQRVALFPRDFAKDLRPCMDEVINNHKFRVINIVNNVFYAMLAYDENYLEGINEVLDKIKNMSIKIYDIFGDSDIEWLYSINQELFVVQRRPITTKIFLTDSNETSDFGGITIVPGKVTGKLIHLNDYQGEKDAIVFAQAILPSHFDVLMNAKGIISLEASLLSHTAILAREMQLPYWAGVDNRLFNNFKNKLVNVDFIHKTIDIAISEKTDMNLVETKKDIDMFNDLVFDILTLNVINNNKGQAELSSLTKKLSVKYYGEKFEGG